MGGSPDAVKISTPTAVVFTATIASYLTAPDDLDLRHLDGGDNPVIGIMKDDGVNGDLQSGDGVYSGTAIVSASSEGMVEFQARAIFPGASGEKSSHSFLLIDCNSVAIRARTV